MTYKFGILGCGLIGKKRADAILKLGHTVSSVYDPALPLAQELSSHTGATVASSAEDVVSSCDIVVIAAINSVLAEQTMLAIRNGKHVIVEKPCGRTPEELREVAGALEAQPSFVAVKSGFNHRFHPAISKAKEILSSENPDDMMFMRARYGHGARLGYEKEWRGKKAIAGGGEWLDQGSHLVDLCRYFAGEFDHAIGYCDNFYWDMETEDNCFSIMKQKNGVTAHLHASCTEWKNMFSMEIYLKKLKLDISGLGRSYGTETLTVYRMKPEMGPPDREVFEFPGQDNSWELEISDMIRAIENKTQPNGNLHDALRAMELIYDVYTWSDQHNPAPFRM